MTTKIYFYENNAYNAVIFTQENGFFIMFENEEVDLYADDAVEQLSRLYAQRIADGVMDLSSLCTAEHVFTGAIPGEGPEEELTFITEYDDEDYKPYVESYI